MEIDPTGLLPYQPAAATKLLRSLLRHGAALDASDMGVGKTAHAVAVLRALNNPSLVVCPRVSISGWRRMGVHLDTSFDVLNYEAIRTGRTPYGWWDNPMPKLKERAKIFKCTRCQRSWKEGEDQGQCPYPLPNGGPHDILVKSVPHKYGCFHWHPNIETLVFDEAHRCAAMRSLHADMLIAARRQRIKTIALSATVADSPLNLRALGYLLGLHNLIDSRDGHGPLGFYQWAFRHGCHHIPNCGLQFAVSNVKKRDILASLHSEIFPERGCRVRIDELGDSFPEVQITAELYDTEARGRIESLYARMQAAVDRVNAKRADDPELVVTEILRDREEIELLLLPVYVELAQDAVAEGRHVGLFFNFRSTVDECCRMLKTDCRVDGSQVGEKGLRIRNANVDRFQRDESEYLVGTTDSAGESIDLHDVRGFFPRLGLVSLPWSARKLRQLFGRMRRALGKSKAIYRCVLAAGTVQERVHRAVSGKLDRIDLLNDGDLCADVQNLKLTNFMDV